MPAALTTTWFILLAIVAGVSIAAQQVVNGGLRSELGSAWWAGLISYVGGTVFMLVALLANGKGLPGGLATLRRVPSISWTGGLLGGLYIALSLFLLPRLGVALVLALIVVGQMSASMTFDHFGLFGLPQHPVGLTRIAGAMALVAGVLLIKLG